MTSVWPERNKVQPLSQPGFGSVSSTQVRWCGFFGAVSPQNYGALRKIVIPPYPVKLRCKCRLSKRSKSIRPQTDLPTS